MNRARAEEPTQPKFRCALVSDAHLGRGGNGSAERMQAAIQEINQLQVDLTVFCGDLVNAGEDPANRHYYGQWREIAGGLSAPYAAVPGNHDPDDVFRRHIRSETDYVLDVNGFRLICFRDAEPNGQTERQFDHMGVVTEDQLRWLRDRLLEAEQQQQKVLLISHVIFHANRHPDVGWYIKRGREAFDELLQAHKNIGAFFAGHFHCGARGWNDTHGIHEVVLPSTSFQSDRFGEQEVPGWFFREFRLGYVLLEAFDDQLRLSYKPLGGEFAATRNLPWPQR